MSSNENQGTAQILSVQKVLRNQYFVSRNPQVPLLHPLHFVANIRSDLLLLSWFSLNWRGGALR
jgi:hypothetical protein